MIDCICGEKIPTQILRKHVKENHETNVIKMFMSAHFKNPDLNVPDSWECMKCRHSKNKETVLVSEETCIEHIRDEHFNEAVKEFEGSLKQYEL